MREDLEHRLDFVIAEREHSLNRAWAEMTSDLNQRGMLASSGAMKMKERLAREHLDEAMLDLVTDVEKAKQAGVSGADRRACLDRAAARVMEVIRERFTEPESDGFGPRYGVPPETLDELAVRASSLIRQYWGGYLSRSAPHGTFFSLTVSGSPGAAIQQGGQGNVQHVENAIDMGEAARAASELSAALASLDGTDDVQALRADLAALQSQLARPAPKRGIIGELAKSARSALENGVGGMLSPAGLMAAGALWKALGLG